MNAVYIIARHYADDVMRAGIGGVESYIQMLANALHGHWQVIVCQPSKKTFRSVISGVDVIGFGEANISDIVREVERKRVKRGDILVFSTDQYLCRTHWGKNAVIQHGVSWDLPTKVLTARLLARIFERQYRVFLSLRNHQRIKYIRNVICVDYNYANWYRTLATDAERERSFFVIPNCAGPQFNHTIEKRNSENVNICFARRIVEIRGVDIFIEVAKGLLARYDNVSITFAGNGAESYVNKIKALCKMDNRVAFLNASYQEMPSVYAAADLVVIPSLASEGTSLTALEAMAMGKCVVGSHVGGLTNVILDGYNGFLVEPTANAFFNKICTLVESPREIYEIGTRAKQVSATTFTYEAWRLRWLKVLDKIRNQ